MRSGDVDQPWIRSANSRTNPATLAVAAPFGVSGQIVHSYAPTRVVIVSGISQRLPRIVRALGRNHERMVKSVDVEVFTIGVPREARRESDLDHSTHPTGR